MRSRLAITALIPAMVLALAAGVGVARAQDGATPDEAPPVAPAESPRVTTPGLTITTEVTPPAPPPPPKGPLPSLEEVETAANLLDHLERRDEDFRRLTAGVQYTRVQALQGDTQTRQGMLYYDKGPAEAGAPLRRFAVDFTRLMVDNTMRNERTAWVFDGQWLAEKDYQTKQFVRRRIAEPGSDVDPLRLSGGGGGGGGGGMIPLPIGQRREDVEKYFIAEIVGAFEGLVPESDALDDPDEGYRGFVRLMGGDRGPEGVYQLKLTPREGTEAAEEYREIRLWYQKGTLIPMMSRAVDRKRDISTVVLTNVDTKSPLPEGVTSTEAPPHAEGWVVREEDRLFEQ